MVDHVNLFGFSISMGVGFGCICLDTSNLIVLKIDLLQMPTQTSIKGSEVVVFGGSSFGRGVYPMSAQGFTPATLRPQLR